MNEDSVTNDCKLEKPSRDELFKLLTEEIRDMTEAEKLKGWTPWVILASLVSGLWILAQDIFSGRHPWKTCWAVFLIVTIAILLLRILQRELETLTEDRTGKASFFFLHLSASAFGALVFAVWFAGIGYVLLWLAPLATHRRIFLAGAWLYGFLAFFSILMMLAVVARLPIPMPRRGPPPLVSLGISAVIVALSVALIIETVRSGFADNLSIVELRIGTIMALEAFGFVFLSRTISEQNDPREGLSEIRRDLILSGISTTEASHRTRNILQGMWLSDVVLKDMNALLKLISNSKDEYEEALHKIATFKANVGIPSGTQSPAAVKLTLGNMLDTLEIHEARISSVIRLYQSLLMSLRFRIKFTTQLNSDADSDGQRLMMEIQRAEAPVDQLQIKFVKEYLTLQREWNLRFPSEMRDHKLFARTAGERSPRPKIRFW